MVYSEYIKTHFVFSPIVVMDGQIGWWMTWLDISTPLILASKYGIPWKWGYLSCSTGCTISLYHICLCFLIGFPTTSSPWGTLRSVYISNYIVLCKFCWDSYPVSWRFTCISTGSRLLTLGWYRIATFNHVITSCHFMYSLYAYVIHKYVSNTTGKLFTTFPQQTYCLINHKKYYDFVWKHTLFFWDIYYIMHVTVIFSHMSFCLLGFSRGMSDEI